MKIIQEIIQTEQLVNWSIDNTIKILTNKKYKKLFRPALVDKLPVSIVIMDIVPNTIDSAIA
jgi:hypothetical protein